MFSVGTSVIAVDSQGCLGSRGAVGTILDIDARGFVTVDYPDLGTVVVYDRITAMQVLQEKG